MEWSDGRHLAVVDNRFEMDHCRERVAAGGFFFLFSSTDLGNWNVSPIEARRGAFHSISVVASICSWNIFLSSGMCPPGGPFCFFCEKECK